MLSNPPYGKSWKTDLERMGGKGEITDPRFLTILLDDGSWLVFTGDMSYFPNKEAIVASLAAEVPELHAGFRLGRRQGEHDLLAEE